MSEATATEEQVTPTSEADTPASPPTLEQETPVPVDGGEETPSTGEETPAPRTPDSYDRSELDNLYSEGKLTDPELVKRRDSLIQSDYDRRVAQAQLSTELKAENDRRLQELSSAKDTLIERLSTNTSSELTAAADRGRDADFELIGERNSRAIADFLAVQEQAALAPYHRSLNTGIEKLAGESPQVQRWLGTATFEEKLGYFGELLVNAGRQAGPAEGYVVKKEAEWKAEKDAAVKAELDAWKANNPNAQPPTPDTPKPTGIKRYVDMTPDERAALPPEERDRLTAQLLG